MYEYDKLAVHFRGARTKRLFLQIVAQKLGVNSQAYTLIKRTNALLEYEFRNCFRESGEGDITHHRSVMLYLLNRLHVRNVDELLAALLHDLSEDIHGWPRSRIARFSSRRASWLVWGVTKDKVSQYGNDKILRDIAFHNKLWNGPRPVGRLKFGDRSHNTLTLKFVPVRKQKRKVAETRDFYFRLARKWNLPIDELRKAVEKIEQSWKP